VDIVARIVGRVELDDPVDGGDVEAAGGDVCAEERAVGRVAELEERVGAFLLLLLALRTRQGRVAREGRGARTCRSKTGTST
jgi:hypothetical protein